MRERRPIDALGETRSTRFLTTTNDDDDDGDDDSDEEAKLSLAGILLYLIINPLWFKSNS